MTFAIIEVVSSPANNCNAEALLQMHGTT